MNNTISLQPSMDEKGMKFFKDAIIKSNCFIEYGCGGSTAYAANVAGVKTIISVDTSKIWIDKVKKSLSSSSSNLFLEYCNLGKIGKWGTPINRDRSKDFWRYMVAPWRIANDLNLVPDLILIDGRFRVASFLYSLVSARVGTLIMFDDYTVRDHYFVVEKFCKLKETHGRMGIFYVEHVYSINLIIAAIAEYSNEWS